MSDWKLVLETSGRIGRVGLACGCTVVHRADLDEKRRHARDLTATIGELLERERLRVHDLARILASIGPGGYTGLRVGLATAKTLAFAADVPLVVVPTFQAIAAQAPDECDPLWVVADALQGMIYHQRFQSRKPMDELKVVPAKDWLPWTSSAIWLTGPGVTACAGEIGCSVRLVPEEFRLPSVDGVLTAGEAIVPLNRDALFAVEPLYLRGSSAEEKRKREAASTPGEAKPLESR